MHDPSIGRFLSPDTIVQAPKDTQSYNRYAYVKNNPLKYTDPSGHSWLSAELHRASKFVKANGPQIASIGLMLALGPGLGWHPVVVGMISGGVAGLIASNGDEKAGFRGAVLGGMSAMLTYGIGHGQAGDALIEDHVLRGIAHGMAQVTMSEMQGGKFKDGFWSGAVGHWAGVVAGKYMIEGNDFDAVAARTSVAAMAGGIAASAGGGKFANGAVTAAFVHLFNEEWKPELPRPPEVKEVFDAKAGIHLKGSVMDGNKMRISENNLSISADVAKLGIATGKLSWDSDGVAAIGVTVGDKISYGELDFGIEAGVKLNTDGVASVHAEACAAVYCPFVKGTANLVNAVENTVNFLIYSNEAYIYTEYNALY